MLCYLCKEQYENKEAILNHLKTAHSINIKVNSLKCVVESCNQAYYTVRNWKKHVDRCFENQSACSLETLDLSKLSISRSKEEQKCENEIICGESAQEHIDNGNASFVFDASNSELCVDQNIIFDCENSVNSSTQIAKDFFMGLIRLELNQNVIDSVFHLVTNLLTQTNDLCCENLNIKTCSSIESVNATTTQVMNDLIKYDSTYKRQKFFESQNKFVKPKEFGIGTHWELKRDKESKVVLPHHVQSRFTYINLLEKISTIFSDEKFRNIYFNYNRANKPSCERDVYKDYCCGAVFKDNLLYQSNSNNLQLQLFTDGFEICDGLKTKANSHSQTPIYFTIRNLPPELSYNQNNIHLLALINSSDLKKRETDYTNVLEIIVRDLKILETQGIDLECGFNIKGG